MNHTLPIRLTPLNQLSMRPLLRTPPLLDQEDTIRPMDRIQPMRNRHNRRPSRQRPQRLLDALLRLHVQRTRRLIQEQHPRLTHQRPRNR